MLAAVVGVACETSGDESTVDCLNPGLYGDTIVLAEGEAEAAVMAGESSVVRLLFLSISVFS